MSASTNPAAVARGRAGLFVLSALAVSTCALSLFVIGKRVAFPYDLTLWPDDYVLNMLVKLRFHAPLYGTFDDANTFIYAPGGVLLHHALLSPFGLDLDIVANRLLAQLWLALAVVLGVMLVARISEGRFAGRAQSIAAVAGAGAALTLAGYSNPVADTLHPATLELLGLTLAAGIAARWPRFSPLTRIVLSLLVPACCMLVKQTGASVGVALAAVALWTPVDSPRRRLLCAAASLASPALAFAGLQLVTQGAFARWGLLLPLRQPRFWANGFYLANSLSVIAPSLLLAITRAERAFAQRQIESCAAWLRAATIPIAYAPLTLLAFLKAGGGGFDFGALAFFGALLGLAQVRAALTAGETSLGPMLVTLIALAQLVLWPERRHAPTAADRAWSANVCAHVTEAMACGERVLVDTGMTCLIRGGLRSAPFDRGFVLMELAWAGLQDQSGTARRIAAEDYGLLVLHAVPVPGVWSRPAVTAINEHYVIYTSIAPAAGDAIDDLDLGERTRYDSWAGLPLLLLERKRDAGLHRLEIVGPPRCKPRPR